MLNFRKKRSIWSGQRMPVMVAAACISSLGISGISAMLSAPAHASTDIEVKTKLVRYHDLDLSRDQDRDILNRRISRAAKQVCTDFGINAVLNQKKIRACAKAAHSRAWSNVDERAGLYQLADRQRN